jgi:hypothetical protein
MRASFPKAESHSPGLKAESLKAESRSPGLNHSGQQRVHWALLPAQIQPNNQRSEIDQLRPITGNRSPEIDHRKSITENRSSEIDSTPVL